jgi:hypothetical protein
MARDFGPLGALGALHCNRSYLRPYLDLKSRLSDNPLYEAFLRAATAF